VRLRESNPGIRDRKLYTEAVFGNAPLIEREKRRKTCSKKNFESRLGGMGDEPFIAERREMKTLLSGGSKKTWWRTLGQGGKKLRLLLRQLRGGITAKNAVKVEGKARRLEKRKGICQKKSELR